MFYFYYVHCTTVVHEYTATCGLKFRCTPLFSRFPPNGGKLVGTTLCVFANQNRGHTQTVVNPSNITYNLVLRKVDVFFKITQERGIRRNYVETCRSLIHRDSVV
jgi:hypothetical protein